MFDRFRKPKPVIDFGQHRIPRRRFWQRLPRRALPVIDFNQHRCARAQSRRHFMSWGIGVLVAGGFLAYPFVRNKRPDWAPEASRWEHQPLTHALLNQIPNEELEYEVVDYVSAVVYRDGYERATEMLAKLSSGFRAVYATWVLQGEVDNGGFSQFFFNSSGELAYEARDGCWLIGARQTAQIVIDAIELEIEKGTPGSTFPDSASYLTDYGEDYEYADYEILEYRFYAGPENLSRLRIKYIREHPEQFVGPAID